LGCGVRTGSKRCWYFVVSTFTAVWGCSDALCFSFEESFWRGAAVGKEKELLDCLESIVDVVSIET